jgi:hypothetical protein
MDISIRIISSADCSLAFSQSRSLPPNCTKIRSHETRHCPPVVYNKFVRHANTYLKEQIQAVTGLHYWNIYGVKNSAVNIFVDGVHFNQDGFLRYYIHVRGAIVQSLGY